MIANLLIFISGFFIGFLFARVRITVVRIKKSEQTNDVNYEQDEKTGIWYAYFQGQYLAHDENKEFLKQKAESMLKIIRTNLDSGHQISQVKLK